MSHPVTTTPVDDKEILTLFAALPTSKGALLHASPNKAWTLTDRQADALTERAKLKQEVPATMTLYRAARVKTSREVTDFTHKRRTKAVQPVHEIAFDLGEIDPAHVRYVRFVRAAKATKAATDKGFSTQSTGPGYVYFDRGTTAHTTGLDAITAAFGTAKWAYDGPRAGLAAKGELMTNTDAPGESSDEDQLHMITEFIGVLAYTPPTGTGRVLNVTHYLDSFANNQPEKANAPGIVETPITGYAQFCVGATWDGKLLAQRHDPDVADTTAKPERRKSF
ncbi:hypothetical protein [Allokutzneria sp. NRRL B-24872]|uniref:hypothetical protein n=1 Tax=Allokutzneria sp. NRRL B-24872 TaxID=1137961 RepID=UPI0011774526|nr:hypothetical protein [Allokutzneria sp. NRRL B-24872]